ncbi:cupin-like domain-containing protein [Sphingomonas sp.]|uniref:cupin-like domain-containing protein n=1 Tax=Sphingomonas sp. TaxID=28214 RepID=UPI001B06A759|nr:cupin-like domain-containing protein [Sphingomonas sp.]MBO9711714.1 cupin-like domain-containing protein [Sphingomonas sp.]
MTNAAPRESGPEVDLPSIAEQAEPVVIRGACRDWPATAAAVRSTEALFDYLRRFDGGQRAEAFVGEPGIAGRYYYDEALDGFNFTRETMTFADALARIAAGAAAADAPSVYMGSVSADRMLPGFSAENRLEMLDPRIEAGLWIGNASHVSCHYDALDNLACVVAGRRRFTLFPPDAVGDLYVGPIDHTMAGQPVGLAVGSPPGDPRYPRFEAVRDRALVAELGPGDALYLPKLWWHRVEALEPVNMLVNYWWDGFSAGPDAPLTTMMLAMIAIAERPERERLAWRAFFDHYVFRPDGHPLAHLPSEKHGILGPLRSNYGRIRAIVMQRLRGG